MNLVFYCVFPLTLFVWPCGKIIVYRNNGSINLRFIAFGFLFILVPGPMFLCGPRAKTLLKWRDN